MPEVLVATPLKYSSVTRAYEFADGICIRELSPILWDISIVKGLISERERQELANAKYWLCAKQDYDYVHGDVGNELYGKALNAALALQVVCPSGAKHVLLKFQKTHNGYDNIGSKHPNPKQLCSTLLGRITALEQQGLERHFDDVYAGIQRAFTEKAVRLQNPVLLLEHGMQIGNTNLGALMFVMGLDILFMAGDIKNFMARAGGFLGLDALVFPPDSHVGRRPKTMVRDVLEDLFKFRNIIAHGQEIPVKPYRTKHELIGTNGERINTRDYYYAELMNESSLFMLTTALRRIFTENLYDDAADANRWREKMRLYEHRYKDAGAAGAVKRRGC